MAAEIQPKSGTVSSARQDRNITISTASPSGGSNGDVWFQYS